MTTRYGRRVAVKSSQALLNGEEFSMREEDKIYADPGDPATLFVDGREPIHCATLQEAKFAWNRLSPALQTTATIRVAGGRVYGPGEIDRLILGSKGVRLEAKPGAKRVE
jgi:hypothetical protein